MRSNTASFDVINETQTEAIGRSLARCLPESFVLCFQGNLGAGKTTLIRAIIRELGVTGPIKSPTFSVVESYCASRVIHHFDLYRLVDPEELEMIGFRDYFSPNVVCFIEWPERAASLLSSHDMTIELISTEATRRQLNIRVNTEVGQQVLTCLLREYSESC